MPLWRHMWEAIFQVMWKVRCTVSTKTPLWMSSSPHLLSSRILGHFSWIQLDRCVLSWPKWKHQWFTPEVISLPKFHRFLSKQCLVILFRKNTFQAKMMYCNPVYDNAFFYYYLCDLKQRLKARKQMSKIHCLGLLAEFQLQNLESGCSDRSIKILL